MNVNWKRINWGVLGAMLLLGTVCALGIHQTRQRVEQERLAARRAVQQADERQAAEKKAQVDETLLNANALRGYLIDAAGLKQGDQNQTLGHAVVALVNSRSGYGDNKAPESRLLGVLADYCGATVTDGKRRIELNAEQRYYEVYTEQYIEGRHLVIMDQSGHHGITVCNVAITATLQPPLKVLMEALQALRAHHHRALQVRINTASALAKLSSYGEYELRLGTLVVKRAGDHEERGRFLKRDHVNLWIMPEQHKGSTIDDDARMVSLGDIEDLHIESPDQAHHH